MTTRRNFLQSACTACAGFAGAGFLMSYLAGCKAASVLTVETDSKTISIALTNFVDKKTQVVRSKNLEFDILTVKNSESNFTALEMKCTHRDNRLTANDSGLFCAAHGSRFNLNGDVTAEPATASLRKYKTAIQENNLIIYLQ